MDETDWFIFAFFGVALTLICLLLVIIFQTRRNHKWMDRYTPTLQIIEETKLYHEVVETDN